VRILSNKSAVRMAIAVLITSAALNIRSDDGSGFFARLDELPPEQQYRQLGLMLMVSRGADEALIQALDARLGIDQSEHQAEGGPAFDFDDYTTPLIRIVDQESMLIAATQLFQFTRANAAGIATRLLELQKNGLDGIEAGYGASISEDAIIVRNAIADSIDYSELADGSGGEGERLSANYRAQTIFIRNNLEYELFAAELQRLTQEAVDSVGGKTDAYERMFDDEIDSAGIDKKIEAAEYVYDWDDKFDARAAKVAEEILNNILDREGDMKP